jgi:hypothetical protein
VIQIFRLLGSTPQYQRSGSGVGGQVIIGIVGYLVIVSFRCQKRLHYDAALKRNEECVLTTDIISELKKNYKL